MTRRERKVAAVNIYPRVSDREQTCLYPWCSDPVIEPGLQYASATIDDVHGKMHLRHTDRAWRGPESPEIAVIEVEEASDEEDWNRTNRDAFAAAVRGTTRDGRIECWYDEDSSERAGRYVWRYVK